MKKLKMKKTQKQRNTKKLLMRIGEEAPVKSNKLTLLEAIRREHIFNPKVVLMEMMEIISQYGRNDYRRCWEMLIEFLGDT